MTPAVDSVTSATGAAHGAERGAGGVVFDDRGRVLVLRHAGGNWVFPKGHLEPGETALQAALREVEEEAGVRARCDHETLSWTTSYVNPRGSRRLITWFAMRSDDPVNLSEALFTEAAYLAPGDAATVLSHEADKRLLADVLAATAAGAGRLTRAP
ncbi:MAG TPA: NUDIX domain-containing protein [Trueperaceae bacterium]|nr:NUDIX domain-containing protein [Trueperaceae bacterium]